jgi:hypothetical protein
MKSIDIYIDELKTNTDEFLDKQLSDIKDIKTARDIVGKFLHYQTNMERFKLIRDPQYTICSTTEKKYRQTYLQAKIYWIDENGKYGRILSRGLGNLEDYPKGLDNEETKDIIKKKVRDFMFKKFVK